MSALFLPRLVLAAAALGGFAGAQNVFTVFMDDGQAVPPISGIASGNGTVTLDVATGAISVSAFYTGLTGIATAAHLHGPAAAGAIAPPVVTLSTSGGFTGSISGGGTLTAQQVTDVLAGLYYVNVHSTTYIGGEMRGQVLALGYTTAYGTINPSGSLAVVAGVPTVNGSVTLGMDDPTGTQGAGSLSFLAISSARDPLYDATGTGTLVPGWGMSASSGELLVSVAPPNPIVLAPGPAWAGPGSPAPIVVAIPNDPTLAGLSFYAQGVLVDPLGPNPFGLTEGRLINVGT